MGRTTIRSIDGSNNSVTWNYDAISPITSEVNALGTFTYTYLNNTSGSSKGDTRLASVAYPNSQVTNYSYFDNVGDQRLKEIENLDPSGGLLSRFVYTYNPAGEITLWQQQQAANNDFWNCEYDKAGQLIAVRSGSGSPQPPYGKQWYYSYDVASNRTGVQQSMMQPFKIAGSITAGDVITFTVKDSGLTGGQEVVSYTVQSGDTLATGAAKLAAEITANTDLLALGVNAVSDSARIFVKSVSPNVTTYSTTVSGGATISIAETIYKNAEWNLSIGGTKTTGDVVTVTVQDAALSGGQRSVTYTVLSGDTLTSIASGVASAINGDTPLSALGVSATSASPVVTITSTSANATTYKSSLNSGATETATLAVNRNTEKWAVIGGTKTTGDVLTITVVDPALSGGSTAVNYTVQSGDTLTTIASGIVTAINGTSALQAIGVSASSSGTNVILLSNSTNATEFAQSRSSGATETVALFDPPPNGTQTAVVGGTITAGDVLTVTTFDAGLTGGTEAVSYTVQSGDTLADIATGPECVNNFETLFLFENCIVSAA